MLLPVILYQDLILLTVFYNYLWTLLYVPLYNRTPMSKLHHFINIKKKKICFLCVIVNIYVVL
jgi:hypothetical protein